MTQLYKIRTKVRGFEGKAVKFDPNRFQRRKYNLVYVDRVRRLIELKSRKFGTTTGWCIDSLDEAAYGKTNWQAVTMAHRVEKSQEIFNDIVKFAWDRVAKGLRPPEKYNTKTIMDFSLSRGSKYVVTNDVKGSTPNRLHITEAAYFEHDEAIIESLNALPDDALGIVESTANGMGNWFEMTFNEAWAMQLEGHRPKWLAIFHPWFDDPNNRVPSIEGLTLRFESEALALKEKYGLTGEQIYWWDQKKQDNRGLVYQFYPSCPEEAFLHSGRPVFDQVNLAMMKGKYARAPLRIEDDIAIWEEPDTEQHYGIGVDTAEGLEHGDNSSIIAVSKETGREVAQCTGKFGEAELARKLDQVCRLFDPSPDRHGHLVIIERNNHGHAVIAYAKTYPAINLYQEQRENTITEAVTVVIGWNTTESSKALAISGLSRDLEDGACVPQSPETYQELQYFVHGNRGIMGAMKGKKDDRVMALSLANVAREKLIILGPLDLASYNIY